MAHRRRKYGSIEIVPGLGDALAVFKQPVKGADVAVGSVASLAGIFVVKKVINKWLVGTLPAFVLNYIPAISGVVAGAALYFAETKLMKGKSVAKLFGSGHAAGHLIGAISTGVAINVMNLLKVKYPELADLVDLRLSGIILSDPAVRQMVAARPMNGLLIRDSGRLADSGFADLAAAGEPEEELFSA